MIHRDFRCELYVFRHGESRSNVELGWMGATDRESPLTEAGVRQAGVLGSRLRGQGVRFDRMYSSTFPRAIHTAELVLDAMGQADLRVNPVEALVERETPSWRGMGSQAALTDEALAYMNVKSSDFVPLGGESHRMARRRISAWLEDELIHNESLTSKPVELNVGVSTHGDTINSILHYVLGMDERFLSNCEPANCSVTRLAFDSGGWAVRSVNDAGHLSSSV
jgi:broad specificity phosphatase PhoE